MKDEVYEFLTMPKKTKLQIRSKQMQIEDLRLQMLPGAVRYDKDIVQSSPEDPMLKFIVRVDELERDIEGLKQRYVDEQKLISEAIEMLEDKREQVVLIGRYVSGDSYDEIAAELFLSVGRVFQIHRSAVDNMVGIVDKMKHYSELQ